MKTSNSNYKKMFIAYIIATAIFNISDLYAYNTSKGSDVLTIHCQDCPVENIIVEEENEIEDWMSSNDYWGTVNSAEIAETDNASNIENWMYSNDYWGTINANEVAEQDNFNHIEKWMGNNDYWVGGSKAEPILSEVERPLTIKK
jgi:hypothetical protein